MDSCLFAIVPGRTPSAHDASHQWTAKEPPASTTTCTEFDSIAQREVSEGRKLILPVWHQVERADVEGLALWLADRVATRTSKGLDVVAKDLVRSIARAD